MHEMETRIKSMHGICEPVIEDWQRRNWSPGLEPGPHKWNQEAVYVCGSSLKADDCVPPEPVCSTSFLLLYYLLFLNLNFDITLNIYA